MCVRLKTRVVDREIPGALGAINNNASTRIFYSVNARVFGAYVNDSKRAFTAKPRKQKANAQLVKVR